MCCDLALQRPLWVTYLSREYIGCMWACERSERGRDVGAARRMFGAKREWCSRHFRPRPTVDGVLLFFSGLFASLGRRLPGPRLHLGLEGIIQQGIMTQNQQNITTLLIPDPNGECCWVAGKAPSLTLGGGRSFSKAVLSCRLPWLLAGRPYRGVWALHCLALCESQGDGIFSGEFTVSKKGKGWTSRVVMEAIAADESGLFSWLLPPVAKRGVGMRAVVWGWPMGMQVGLPLGTV